MQAQPRVLKSRDGIPHPIAPPPGIDMAQQARIARSRFYPVTIAYTAYALVVLPLGFRAAPWLAFGFLAAGIATWTLVEYLVHRYILHGRFADGKGWLEHRIHQLFDTTHGNHHLRPWDGMHINGRFDTVPFAILLALLSFLAPLPTWPVFLATILQCYVLEEWVHYSVHFHQFKWKYFVYIRKHHLFHHSAKGGDIGYGLTSGLWDVPFRTRIPARDREILYGRGKTGASAAVPKDTANAGAWEGGDDQPLPSAR